MIGSCLVGIFAIENRPDFATFYSTVTNDELVKSISTCGISSRKV